MVFHIALYFRSCETGSQKKCVERIMSESARSLIFGFDRVIFCTGFVFKGAEVPTSKDVKDQKRPLFADNVCTCQVKWNLKTGGLF